MLSCGSLMRTALVAAVLLAVVQIGSADKLATCCKTVSKKWIAEPITGYMVQHAHPPCVAAVIIQTETGVYCVHRGALWLRPKIKAYEKAKSEATTKAAPLSSTASLLSLITPTNAPTGPSTSFPSTSFPSTSFPSATSQVPDETFGENAE